MSKRCVLCNELFSRPKDKYLIQGRSKENLLFELESLPFTVDLSSSKHLCRRCVNVLKKRRSLILQVREIENGLKAKYPDASSTTDAIDNGDSKFFLEEKIQTMKSCYQLTFLIDPCLIEPRCPRPQGTECQKGYTWMSHF
jgi:hypothetical protein